jgi:hypothetical protein
MTNRPVAKWMRKEDDQLRAAVASGETVAAISKRLCRSEKGVRYRAEKLGVELPSRQRFGSPKTAWSRSGLRRRNDKDTGPV